MESSGSSCDISMVWIPSSIQVHELFSTPYSILEKIYYIGTNEFGYVTKVYDPTTLEDILKFIQSL